MAAYEAFAKLYDALMDDVDYDEWARYYVRLIESVKTTPKTLCDCACGTGSMSVRFAAQGMRVTGVDRSGEMLEQAQAKARRFGVPVMFVRQDMCALELPRPVDALVCACDGVNYLLDDDRLNAFFQRVHAALKPGGAFAFDISSAWKLSHVLGNNMYGEDRDEATYLWTNRYDEGSRTVTMELTFFTEQRDGLYRRFDETHIQKAHEPEHLRQLLVENGFDGVRIYGDRCFESPEPHAPRIHFVAVRE